MSSTANAILITAGCPEPCVTSLQILDIPAAILVVIMQHVPLQQRLGVCTRVCHAFHTAAVAATDSISITTMSSQAQSDNVSQWLQLHGGDVTSFHAQHGRRASLASLPCPALRDLNLPRAVSAARVRERLHNPDTAAAYQLLCAKQPACKQQWGRQSTNTALGPLQPAAPGPRCCLLATLCDTTGSY